MSVFVNGTSAKVHGKEYKGGFDANAAMVLSVLVCAVVISLGLNSIIKCLRRCSRLLYSSSSRVSQNSTMSLTATGITQKAQKSYLTIAYLAGPHVDAQCVICLAEFATSEIVLILPKCHHGFHVSCIGKWLRSHSSCPTCRHSLIEAPEKNITVGHEAAAASLETLVLQQPQSAEEAIVVIIAPLEPEGVVLNYRRVCSSQLLSELA
ncbi:unnamed protein product [Rhodiola kirilowii]